jgi:glyoxylase-like metal-dependent hydrolase (beta-lactamase superfamily II)
MRRSLRRRYRSQVGTDVIVCSAPVVDRTNSAADFTSLITDVTDRLFGRLPDATWVYPGHGNDTTLGTERPHLGEWRARGW